MVDAWFKVNLGNGDTVEISITGNCAVLKWHNPDGGLIDKGKFDLPVQVYENGALWLIDFVKFMENISYGE